MRRALAKLAEFAGDDTIAARSPFSSMSFSRVSPQVERQQDKFNRSFAKDQHRAYSPLGPNGRPIRRYAMRVGAGGVGDVRCTNVRCARYSERTREHWFYGERDGLSYVDTHEQVPHEPIPTGALVVRSPKVELVSSTFITENAVRRNVISYKSIDRLVIQGNVSKVSTVTGLPFHKFMLKPGI